MRANYVAYDQGKERLRCVFFLGRVGTSWESVDDAQNRLRPWFWQPMPAQIDQSTQEVMS